VPDYGRELQFGAFIRPVAAQAGEVLELARVADVVGLDLVTFQDHPYQPSFLDTWTLLAVVASQTSSVRVAPNVANLPLRPPVVLARSVATLDVLSGGRIELGLGAGAFRESIAALGGPSLTPGESVDALDEALDVIRAVWAADDREVEGRHYRIGGGKGGLAPAHDVEIWLGAYKPRMLAITGQKADGWLPSMSYAPPDELPAMQERIDEAATAAGRSPAEIRRLYNVDAGARGLQGLPADWAEQLGELALVHGIDTFILAISSADDLRLLAEEVAPATRELVEAERASPAHPGGRPARVEALSATPLAVQPTPDDGARLSAERVWDESTRPSAQRDDDGRYTPDQQAAGRHLVDVHDGLRAELERIRDLLEQVGRGEADPVAVRSLLTRMTIRQNNWAVGVHCQAYCRILTGHHTLEDRGIFPHLGRRNPQLDAVLHRLDEEHQVIADLLDQVDDTLVALVGAEDGALDRVRDAMDVLTDALLSHFAYEERELVEPLARFGYA
jgi:alkanesulfonate monooxygenase SsuD/methylene tetrahydromethanopterin reductase-like flavin-dependent oxidoreductase (luciferase family)